MVSGVGLTGSRASAQSIDPYGNDAKLEVGPREAVCREDRPGRRRLMAFFAQTWPALQGVGGYSCREINDVTPPIDPDCNGEQAPAYSTCWSTHAAGRAIDLMVGGGLNAPTPAGIALGDEIVTWLLAPRHGQDHWFARTMGIQQILWNGRCWNANDLDDRRVTSAAEMDRSCRIRNHDNHPHLTLTNAGADGLTSWFASAQ